MGAGLARLTVQDVVERVKSIGSFYHKFEMAIVHNAVDGNSIIGLTDEEIEDCFSCVGVTNRFQKRVLITYFFDNFPITRDTNLSKRESNPVVHAYASSYVSPQQALYQDPFTVFGVPSNQGSRSPQPLVPNPIYNTGGRRGGGGGVENKQSSQFSVTPTIPQTDCFITYDYEACEMDPNCDYIKAIDKVVNSLRLADLKPFISDGTHSVYNTNKIVEAMDFTKCFVVFISEKYLQKINSENVRDKCCFEFVYGTRIHSATNCIIPIIVDSKLSGLPSRKGKFGNLGDSKPVMLGNHTDTETFERLVV